MDFKIVQFALDALKLAPRYLISVSIMAAIVLFSPESFLQKLGLFQLAEDYRPWIGGAFIATTALWCVHNSSPILEWIRFARTSRGIRKKQLQKLQSLTEDEKKILRFYITNQTKSNNLTIGDGVVNGLVSAGVILRAHQWAVKDDRFAYNITEFSWKYIQEHKSVLNGTTTDLRTDLSANETW